MKKAIALLLAAMMLFALCACGAKEEAAPAGSEAEEAAQTVDYGASELYTTEEMDSAIALINDQIGQWEGVELKSLRYAGDEAMTEENVAWLNELEGADSENPFTQVIEFVSDFHVGADIDQTVLTFEPDTDYTDYQWWLARTEGGEWQLMSMGY